MMEACSIPGQFRDSHVSTGLTNPDHVSLGQIIDVTLAASYLSSREPESNGIDRMQNNLNLAKSLRKREISRLCHDTSSGIGPPQPWSGPWMGSWTCTRAGLLDAEKRGHWYRASAPLRADQRSNLLLRVSSFGSTLRVYGVAAGGCLIPVGAGVDRFRFRYAFSDSVHRLGRMPCRRADDQPQEIHESLKSRGLQRCHD